MHKCGSYLTKQELSETCTTNRVLLTTPMVCLLVFLVGICSATSASAATETVRDEFNTISYGGNDGSQNWSNNWQELGESDGPSNGRVRVVSSSFCASPNCLRIGGNGVSLNGRGVTREANLTGATSATLNFSFRRDVFSCGGDDDDDGGCGGDDDDDGGGGTGGGGSIALAVSNNGGASWTTLQTFDFSTSDNNQIPQTFDISPFIAPNTQIRFLGSGSNVTAHFFADNVEFSFFVAGPGETIETTGDNFATSSFGNNDGTVNWATNWLEVDGAGAGPTAGNVQITGGELSLDDNPNTGGQPSLEREANVAGATAAIFSFDFRTTSGVDTSDSVVVEVSNNGGASWSLLENFTGFAGVTSGIRNFDISNFIAANTRVRFRVNNLYGGSNETFLVDNVEVAFTLPAGGNNPPIAVDDSYSTPQNITLVVPAATGVLANDSDPDGDPLSVNPTPVSGPSSGTLTLATDGGFTYVPNSGVTGPDSFVYEVSDGQGGTDQATVTLTVTPVGGNNNPVAVDDSYSTPQDTTLTVPAATGVLANDSDPDGDPLSVNPTPVSGPSQGILTLATDGGFTYVPNSGVTGPDSFVYEVTDGQGGSAQGTVTLTITPVGDASEVGFWAFDEGSGTTALDSSGLGNTGSFVGTPSYVPGVSGTALSFPGDGSRVLVPDAASLDVTSGITITAFVQPTQVGTQYLVKKARQNGTAGVDDGYELSLASSGLVFGRFNQPSSGNTFRVNSTSAYPTNGTRIHTALTYDGQAINLYINGVLESTVPAPGLVIATNALALSIGAQDNAAAPFNGILDQVHVFDGALTGSEIQALIDSETSGGGNNNPVAVDDSYSTPQDTTLTVPAATGVLANDSDPDGDPLSVNPTPVSGPSQGILTLATDGGFTYVPNTGVTGTDSFVYEVNDGQGGTDQGTVTLTVTPVSGVNEVGFWAFDEGSGTTALDSSGLGNTGSFVGTPSYVPGVSGTALSFPGDGSRVLVPDAASLDVTSGITITAFVQPTQVGTQYLVKKARQNGTAGVDDGYELSLASSGLVFGRFNQPSSGNTFRVNSTSAYPTNGTRIHTALTYDGQAINLYINGVLESTVPAPGLVIASNALALSIGAQDDAAAPFNGLLDQVHVFDGALTGSEIQALIDSETSGGGNNNPVAVDDSYSTPQDTTLTVPAATGVLANDSDPDGDPLSVNPTPVSGPSSGTLTLATDGGFTYVPNTGVTGTDSFVYEVSDEQGGTDQATVTLTVTPVGGGVTALVSGSDTSTIQNPDGQYGKPNQSRLWFNSTANRWDAVMPQNDGGTSASDHYIMTDVSGTQVFTTVELEDRNTARPDVFWDDATQTLSVLGSHGTATEFWQVLYDAPSDSYSINPAVNAVVVPGITQLTGNFPATLTVSPNGRVWVAVMKDNALEVQHSTDGGATWLAAPVNLDTTAGLGVTTWVQFVTGGVTQVGLFAGENGEAAAATNFLYYFIAQDADPTVVTNWTNDSGNIPAPVGTEQSDDHVSAARDANNNQYFAVKTEAGSPTDPLINLYRRTAAGVWSQFTVTQTQDSPEQTRPSLVIDDSNATLSVYTSDTGSGNGLGSRKTVSLSALGGLGGAPLLPVFNIPGTVFNDLITPRQPVTVTSGVVVLGHNRTEQTVWFSAEAVAP